MNKSTNEYFVVSGKNLIGSSVRVNKEIEITSNVIKDYVIINNKSEIDKNTIFFYNYINCFYII
jgi:hypothetical protein